MLQKLIIYSILIIFVCKNVLSRPKNRFFLGTYFGKYSKIGLPNSNSNINLSYVKKNYFVQYLNHFEHSDIRKWEQRYFVNDKYFKKGGPVFLLLGGEGEFSVSWMKFGQIAQNYARKFNAYYIGLEHRFYGKSRPRRNLSIKNLKYLNSEQALADAANFIKKISLENSNISNSKWIVFGGSYSGSLAAWLRLKYPHLVLGSVSSSAPFNAKLNFYEYLEVVGKSLGSTCSNQMKIAIEKLDQILKNNTYYKELQSFKLCSPYNNMNINDKNNLKSILIENINGIVQYNENNRAFISPAFNITIKMICNIMKNNKLGNELERFSEINSILLKLNKEKCLDYRYDNFLKSLKNIKYGDESRNDRQWTYQVCTEFGYFQTTDSKNQPFYKILDSNFSFNLCKDVFKNNFNKEYLKKSIEHTNIIYGGYNLTSNHIILINGSIDPWHVLSLNNYTFNDIKSIFIQNTAHCADMYPDSIHDSIELKKARQEIENFIYNLLQN